MANKKIWLGMLFIILLAFVFNGCEEEPEYITVTFDANGGRWNDHSTIRSVTVLSGSLIESVEEQAMESYPTRAGYTFWKWMTEKNRDDPNASTYHLYVHNDLTLYAQWY